MSQLITVATDQRVAVKNVPDQDLRSVLSSRKFPAKTKLFAVQSSKIKSLDGIEGIEYESLNLVNNPQLESLKGLQRSQAGYLRINNCGISSLEHIPDEVNELAIRDCANLTTIDVLPTTINGWLMIDSKTPVSLKVLKKVKLIGGSHIQLSCEITNGLLHLFHVNMPKFEQLELHEKYKSVQKELSKRLVQANANPRQRNAIMLDTQDYLIDQGFDALATP